MADEPEQSGKEWSSLEPYVQLVRALMPRAAHVAVFNPAGELKFLSDASAGPDLYAAVQAALSGAAMDVTSEGEVQRLPDQCANYYFWLRDIDKLVAIVAVTTKAGGNQEPPAFKFVQSLLRPALECLRRDLGAQTRIEQLTESLTVRDRDLDVLLAGPGEGNASTGDGADDLKAILDSCSSHLDSVVTALIIPDKSLILIKAREGETKNHAIVAKMHRQLLSTAQARREPVIVNQLSGAASMPFRILSCPVRNSRGRPIGVLALFRSDTAAKFVARDARLVDLLARKAASIIASIYDGMTGLLTRQALENRMRRVVAQLSGAEKSWSALFIDVDQLHMINEELGMHVGDTVIERIGELIRKRLPSGGLAARISGDLFCVLLPATLEDAGHFAESLREGVEQLGILQGDARARVAVSVGVAAFDVNDLSLTHAIAEAESACKAAKDRGRNRVETYQDADASIVRRFEDINVAGLLRAAIAEDRFRLDGQLILPLADSPTLRPHYEILLRMIGVDGNTVGPDRFMSAAVRYQLMPTIDRWVVDKTILSLQPHAELLATRPLGFAINLSGQSLSDDEFPDYLVNAIEKSGLNPKLFCFEVTESAAIANIAKAELLMRRLRKLGCQIALDDFGTGLSSLSYLKSLPVDILKIDGSFVRDILRDTRSDSMVAAIAQLARGMSIETVAEYVETDEILTRIAKLGVDYGQGYAIGKPTPLAELLLELPVLAAAYPVVSDEDGERQRAAGALH
jgi:diguanylate cyclase (GGDEF)-like protein